MAGSPRLIPDSEVQRQMQLVQAKPSNKGKGATLYAFYVVDMSSGTVHDQFGFDIPPKSIRLRENAAAEAIALQEGGYYSDERGQYFPTLSITGTFGFRPTQRAPRSLAITEGRGGQLLGSQFAALQAVGVKDIRAGVVGLPRFPAGERTGFDRVRDLQNLIRDYWNRNKKKKTAKYAFVWADWKFGEVWVAQVMDMERSQQAPGDRFKTNYTINLRLLEPLDQAVSPRDFLPKINAKSGKGTSIGLLKQLTGAVEAVVTGLKFVTNLPAAVGDLVNDVLSPVTDAINTIRAGLDGAQTLLRLPQTAFARSIDILTDAGRNALLAAQQIDEISQFGSQGSFKEISYKYKTLARLLPSIILNMLVTLGLSTVNEEASRFSDAYKPKDNASALDPQGVPLNNPVITDRGSYTAIGGRTIPEGEKLTTIPGNTSIKSLAAQFLGHAGRWKEIALLNRLRAPYISKRGDGVTVLRPGQTIKLPAPPDTEEGQTNQVFNHLVDGPETDAYKYGRDIAVDLDTRDMFADPTGDLAVVQGLPNLRQAMHLKIWHKPGDLKVHPWYGFGATAGELLSIDYVARIQMQAQITLLSDTRIDRIVQLAIQAVGDVLRIKAIMIPKDQDDTIALSISG